MRNEAFICSGELYLISHEGHDLNGVLMCYYQCWSGAILTNQYSCRKSYIDQEARIMDNVFTKDEFIEFCASLDLEYGTS